MASCVAAKTVPSGANSISCTLILARSDTGAHVAPSSVERYIVPPQLPPGAMPASTTPGCVGDAATSATSPPGGPSRLQLPVPAPALACVAPARPDRGARAPCASLRTLALRGSECGVKVAIGAGGAAIAAALISAHAHAAGTNDRKRVLIRDTLDRMRE